MTVDSRNHRPSEAAAQSMRVGRYELIAPLGRGAMATVHLARSVGSAGFERLAAVKALHRDLCSDRDLVDRFLDEARLAARLHHPNAAAIIDVGVDGWQPYMVMDYVEGDTLHAVQCVAVAKREAVPVGVVLRVVLDALAGLDAAHELRDAEGAPLGLIHRDVSPHNVLVGVDGVARLMDFGIARAATRKRATVQGVVPGNVQFMAPEQMRGRELDRRADVFSMGVTLWETLALRRCFPNREGALMSRFARESYRPLGDQGAEVPAALDDICRRALAAEPGDRFATAAAFATAIEDAFGRDVATQRELAQYMAVAAAEKVEREREAARASAQPLPDRAHVALSMASTMDDRVVGPRPAAVAQSKLSTRRFGALASPAGAGSLYDAVTQALFRRSHARALAVVAAPSPEPATVKVRAMPSRPPAFGARVTLRPARASARPPPTGLDGPTRPMSALRTRPAAALALLPAAPRRAPWFSPLRGLVARLWSRLAR